MKSSKSKYRNYIIYTLSSRASTYNRYANDWKWEPRYYNRQEFIDKLARDFHANENALKHISEDMSETRGERVSHKLHSIFGDKKYWQDVPMYFLAKLENDTIVKVSMNDFVHEVEARAKVLEEKRVAHLKQHNYYKKLKGYYNFRSDPVPSIHNYKNHHRGTWYRHPETHQSKSKAFDYELAELTGYGWDPKARNLPTAYDDICRHKDKSWKTSCKVKKQWAKHCPKHVDTLDFNRKQYNMEYETLEVTE